MMTFRVWKNGDDLTPTDLNSNFAETNNVGSIGLKADGVTDNSPILQQYLDTTTGDVVLVFSKGITYFGSTITTSGARNVYIAGTSRTSTILKWGNGVTTGWNHGQGTAGDGMFTVKRMTLLATNSGVGTCLRVSVHSTTSRSGFVCDDVEVGNPVAGGIAGRWFIGFDLYGCSNCSITNSNINQLAGAAYPNNSAVRYSNKESGVSGTDYTTQMSVSGLNIQDGDYGFQVSGGVQGINFVNCNFTGPRHGISWVSTMLDAAAALQVVNCQFACSLRHIFTQNVAFVEISNNTLLQFDQFSTGNNWCSIELTGYSALFLITNNAIVNPGGTVVSTNPVILVRSTINQNNPSRIAGNLMLTENVAPVELRGAIFGVTVADNDFWNKDVSSCNVLQTAAPAWAAAIAYTPLSAVTKGGRTFTTLLGGLSGTVGPVAGGGIEGGVTWADAGPSLASYPNSCSNSIYAKSPYRQDMVGNIVIGSPSVSVNVQSLINTTDGINLGSPGIAGYVDLMSSTTTGNDFDSRIAVSGGITGTNQTGLLTVKAGSLVLDTAKLGFYSAASVTKPIVSGSRETNSALTSLLAALVSLGLITDMSI